MKLLQSVDEYLLLVGKEMGVDVQCGGHGFVTDAVCDVQRGETGVDEQRYMGVTNVVCTDGADTGIRAAFFQFEKQVVACPFKEAVIGLNLSGVDVDENLIQQELRNVYIADTFFGLGRGDDILAVDLGVGLGDADLPTCGIDVRGSQRQQLALAHTGPVEDLKSGERLRISRKTADKQLVFFQCPEVDLFGARAADVSCLGTGIRKIVVALRVVHER